VPAWKSECVTYLIRFPLLCQKYTISNQPELASYGLHNDLSDK